MGISLACMHVHHQDGIRSLGTRLIRDCKASCGCQKLNPGSLHEKQVLFINEVSL